jgi:rod shape-determining protein MreD
MKTFLIILFLLLAVVLQTTIFSALTVWGVAPNLVLVLVLLLVILKSFKETWLAVLATGLLLDLFSGLPFGLISLSLVTSAFLVGRINKSLFSTVKFWITVSLIILGTLFYNLLLFGLSKLLGVDLVFGLTHLFIETVYNLLLIIIFKPALFLE